MKYSISARIVFEKFLQLFDPRHIRQGGHPKRKAGSEQYLLISVTCTYSISQEVEKDKNETIGHGSSQSMNRLCQLRKEVGENAVGKGKN